MDAKEQFINTYMAAFMGATGENMTGWIISQLKMRCIVLNELGNKKKNGLLKTNNALRFI
jgi:hypothetical protein